MSAETTVAGVLDWSRRLLAAAGLPEPRREARLAVMLASGMSAEAVLLHPECVLESDQIARLEEIVQRRARGEPISRIAGVREFWSLPFRLSADTLDPRPDSETLVQALLDSIPDRGSPLRLLDLGTGTGCLLLALLSELPVSFGVGIDLSVGACRTARANAIALGLGDRAAFVAGNWSAPLIGPFDVVISNPPYIPRGALGELPEAVGAYDPRLALDGGGDGLAAYRALSECLGDLLKPGGVASLEVGAGQGDAVATMLGCGDLRVRGVRRDLAGIERCVLLEAPPFAGESSSRCEKSVSKRLASHYV